MIGPTHGAQSRPNPPPITSPPPNPSDPATGRSSADARLAAGLSRTSRRSARRGMRSPRPIPASATMASSRRRSVVRPSDARMVASATAVSTKLMANPTTTPAGRRAPPPVADPSTSGTTGRVHGARIVNSPAMNAAGSRMSMEGRLIGGHDGWMTPVVPEKWGWEPPQRSGRSISRRHATCARPVDP